MKKLFKTLFTLIFVQLAFSPVAYANETSGDVVVAEQYAVININTANQSELQTLPGIGKSKAKAIIEYRKNLGEFSQIEDITNVKGICKKLLAKLEGKITV